LPQLTDYLDSRTIRELQDAFRAAAEVPVRICLPDGSAILAGGPEGGQGRLSASRRAAVDRPDVAATVPVTVDGDVVGRVTASVPGGRAAAPQTERFLRLAADVVARLCKGEVQLHARVSELTTLFALAGEFSGPRDLESLLDLVAGTVVTALAGKACSIRLLSDDRTELVIKAVANLSPEYLEKGPILLSESRIDQEALSTGRAVYVADEQTDPRVLYPKEARSEGIVSALCAPLVYKDRAEGVIHVYTDYPHEFDWFEVSLLQAIAGQAAGAIVNARLREEAERAANLKRHLQMAAVVQRRMTPPEPSNVPGLDFGAVYVPCFELAGDFYDFIPLPGENLGVAICDVAGKGIRASLLMAMIRASLRAHASNIYAMATVLDRVNRDLCAVAMDSDFATLFYGVVDTRSRRFTYANAGHPPPLLFRAGQLRELGTGGSILGIDAALHWTHQDLQLQPGDVVLAYTDGLTDAMNFADEPFGRPRIEAAARAAIAQGLNAKGIARHVLWEMRRFAGLQTRFDDLTIVVMTVP